MAGPDSPRYGGNTTQAVVNGSSPSRSDCWVVAVVVAAAANAVVVSVVVVVVVVQVKI